MRGRSEKGSVMILALWTLMFLSILTVVFASMGRQQIILADRIEQRGELYDLTSSGAFMVLDLMSGGKLKDLTPGSYSMNESWAGDASVFGPRELGRGMFTFKREYTDNVTGRKYPVFGLVDEERKININYADKDTLGRLFSDAAGLDVTEAAAVAHLIVDWRDADDVLYNHEDNQSERLHYGREGYGYRPRNMPFVSVEELLLVDGVNNDVFLSVRDLITAFGDGKVNMNTAPVQVLEALGLSHALAEKVGLFRSGGDTRDGTPDDNVFTSAEDIIPVLKGYSKLTKFEEDELNKLVSGGMISVRSDVFNMLCTGRLDRGSAEGKLLCVFTRDGRVKYWGYKMQEGSGA